MPWPASSGTPAYDAVHTFEVRRDGMAPATYTAGTTGIPWQALYPFIDDLLSAGDIAAAGAANPAIPSEEGGRYAVDVANPVRSLPAPTTWPAASAYSAYDAIADFRVKKDEVQTDVAQVFYPNGTAGIRWEVLYPFIPNLIAESAIFPAGILGWEPFEVLTPTADPRVWTAAHAISAALFLSYSGAATIDLSASGSQVTLGASLPDPTADDVLALSYLHTGGSAVGFSFSEQLAGTRDGSNLVFTSAVASTGTGILTWSGTFVPPSLYTVSGGGFTITLDSATFSGRGPVAEDRLVWSTKTAGASGLTWYAELLTPTADPRVWTSTAPPASGAILIYSGRVLDPNPNAAASEAAEYAIASSQFTLASFIAAPTADDQLFAIYQA